MTPTDPTASAFATSRRRALVTGASAGIGQAFAHVLASEGHDLVLTARRVDRLDALAAELRHRYNVSCRTIAEDLADAAAPRRIVETCATEGLPIDILINNAGYGVPGAYAKTTWEDQQQFLQVLVVALSELTHRLLPGMIERRWGRILNVASLAGLLPGVAGHTLYAASKAYVIKFSESLALETSGQGIYVTASCPGFTRSEFHDVIGTRAQVNNLPAFMWQEAEPVARGSYDALMAGVPIFVPGPVNRSIATLARLMPRALVWKAMKRSARNFRRV